MLTSTNWFVLLLAFTIALGLHGMIYGPLADFIGEQFGTGSRYTGAVFLGGMAVVSIIALLLTRESKDHDLATHEH